MNTLYIVHEFDIMNDEFTVHVENEKKEILLKITEEDATKMVVAGLDPYTNKGVFEYASHLLKPVVFERFEVLGEPEEALGFYPFKDKFEQI